MAFIHYSARHGSHADAENIHVSIILSSCDATLVESVHSLNIKEKKKPALQLHLHRTLFFFCWITDTTWDSSVRLLENLSTSSTYSSCFLLLLRVCDVVGVAPCFVTQGFCRTMPRCLKIHLRKAELAHSLDSSWIKEPMNSITGLSVQAGRDCKATQLWF